MFFLYKSHDYMALGMYCCVFSALPPVWVGNELPKSWDILIPRMQRPLPFCFHPLHDDLSEHDSWQALQTAEIHEAIERPIQNKQMFLSGIVLQDCHLRFHRHAMMSGRTLQHSSQNFACCGHTVNFTKNICSELKQTVSSNTSFFQNKAIVLLNRVSCFQF